VYDGLLWGGVGRRRWDGSAREDVGFGHRSVTEGAGFVNVDRERVGKEEIGKFFDFVTE
jgi:hypothetical protein